MSSSPSSSALLILQWLARIAAAIMLLLVLAIAIGEGVPNPLHFALPIQLEFASLAMMLVGLAIGWRSEVVGGIVVLLGLLAFNIVELAVHHRLAGRALPFFAIPAMLYLLHAILSHRWPRHA